VITEDARQPKKRKKRRRPDPKRSRAAKLAAKKPKAKRAREKARKAFVRSGAGKQFYKKLGKFNSRRAMLRHECALRHGVLALREFMNTNPPHALREEAEELYRMCSQGQIHVTDLRDRIDRLAARAEDY
jgi:hypothetical protein